MPEIKYPEALIESHCAKIIGAGHFDKVTDQIYIGDVCASSSVDIIQKLKITNIINACDRCPNVFEGISYFDAPLNEQDNESENYVLHLFEKTNNYIEIAQISSSSVILVSSWKGESRSAAVIIAYLMKSQSIPLEHAKALLAEHRDIFLAPHLEKHLKTYENIIKKIHLRS